MKSEMDAGRIPLPLHGFGVPVAVFLPRCVAIRTGHHCTQPVMEFFGVPATARASFAFYNTRGEVDALVEALQGVRKVFG